MPSGEKIGQRKREKGLFSLQRLMSLDSTLLERKSSSSVFRTPRPSSRASKRNYGSGSSVEEETDYEIKLAKLELLREQKKGQELLNEQHKLSIEKMHHEVETIRRQSHSSVSSSMGSTTGAYDQQQE
uniref:Uncharacterized protein n=1 Tax=Globodera rostochiensis TaxID=31243 RepID=A0A914H8H2_GLORO